MTKRQLNATKPKEAGIHSTHGKDQLLFVRAIINGVLCAAYIKNDELVSYEPWDAINRQMYTDCVLISQNKEFITWTCLFMM